MTKSGFRSVTPLDPVIEKDAYNFLLASDEEILQAVHDAIDQGFTPEEIYRHWLRRAGYHRIELAIRCKNAAHHILRLERLEK
jgi:hypothetical protein